MAHERIDDAPARLLSDYQVAELLNVHRSTVWDLAKVGKLPKPHKISGRLVRWSAVELQNWHDNLIAAE